MIKQTTFGDLMNHWEIIHNDRVVGIFTLHIYPDRIGFWSFEVFENERGKGIGTQCLRDLVDHLRILYPQVPLLELFVYYKNVRAIKLYEKFGFKMVPGQEKQACQKMIYELKNK